MSPEPKYITDYLMSNAGRLPDKLAIEFEGRQLSWRELWREVEDQSGYFERELGAKRQKIVALLLTNSIDFVITYLAVLHSGHIVLPLDPAYKKLELDTIINQLKPALVVTSPRYLDQVSYKDTVLFGDLAKIGPAANPLRIGADRQIASLTFTSGTSGHPKAVPNTHANQMWSIKVCSIVWKWTEKDSLLLCLPLSHWYGLVMGLAGVIYHGNSLYLKQQAFKAEEILDELSSGRITMFTHVPLGYAKLLEADPAGMHDLSSVRVCISGSAALAPAIWREFKHRFGVEVVETYGSSETGRIAGNSLDNKVLGSPGPALPEVKVKLSEDEELLVKSPGLFPGYYKNPAATKAALMDDGYWRTGDIAEIKDGNIFLKGRLQERIRRFGYTISPRDVEWALLKNPRIREVLVMGRQEAETPNDELVYFMATSLNDEQVKAYCKENLLFAWRPDRIIRVEALPRTRTGKASLPELRKLAELSG
jgi:acyl-CoA synthetase (AMP-forming)/AMP-acid ligase II